MVFVAPSIDSHGLVNPSMRIYHLDATTYELVDYEQYYFNIDVNGDAAAPKVEHLYNATEEYDLPDMKPSSWMALLKRFETDQALLLKHRGHRNSNAGSAPRCDDNCRLRHVCSHMHAHYDHFEVCAAGPQPATTTTVRVSPTFPPLERPGGPGGESSLGVAKVACVSLMGVAMALVTCLLY